jgi:hypothetical protein
VLPPELLQAVVAIIIGCLFGLLVYLVPEALWPRLPEPVFPRAVVLVPERMCYSLRCLFARPEGHLVEVEVLERGARCIKVNWPSAFQHLDEWIQVADVPGSPSVSNGIRVLEDLPAYPLWTSSEFERWLQGVDVRLDALDAESGGIVTAN